MNFIDISIHEYIEQHTTAGPDYLQELVQVSEAELEHTDMLSGRQVGQLLHVLVKLGKCERLLEVGTFTGYSALWMADALPENGELITLEMNEQYKSISDRFFSLDPYQKKINQIMGNALVTIDKLPGVFDMIFLDADKNHYPEYYRKLKPKLKTGGLLVADNVLWSGNVLDPQDDKSRAIDTMNRLIQNDPDFINLVLPVRDGLMLAMLVDNQL